MTRAMEHCDDTAMEHCDDTVMEHGDDKNSVMTVVMENCDKKCHGTLC